jgi:putative CocE/NonD family hydrolase
MTARAVEAGTMRTRDGVRLDADIYRPDGPGPWPVLLLRQAYGRRVAATVVYAHPSWYAAQGYIVVVQDVRGRGTSDGFFEALEHEAQDGADTIAWCAGLAGSTGQVGMYGFSYQGMNQLLAATVAGPALRAIAPAMIGWDVKADLMEEGGVPQLAGAVGWAAQLGADTARHQGDLQAYEALKQAALSLPLHDTVSARPAVLERFSRYHHYGKWLLAAAEDPIWQRLSPSAWAQTLAGRGLPMLFIGGWYDFMLPGTLAAWEAIRPAQPDRTQLIVGPWAHLPWGQVVGGYDFGPQAVSHVDLAQIAWFDCWLKGKPDPSPAVRLFDMGTKAWVGRQDLRADPIRFHLAGDGRAAVDPGSGLLLPEPLQEGQDVFVHDPWRPAPTHGGRFGAPPGPLDRREIDQRGDILTFTSSPMKVPLEICGRLLAEFYVEADCPSFDLHCTVSRITTDDEVRPFAEGVRRVEGPIATIDLMASCMTLMRGERLRLSIAAASYPAFTVNPGFGDPAAIPHMQARTITIHIRHGHRHPSALIINAKVLHT